MERIAGTLLQRERAGLIARSERGERGEPADREPPAVRGGSPEGVFETLIAGAQESGRLAAEDVTVALEEVEIEPTQLDEFYSRLDELQIEVVEAAGWDEDAEREAAARGG